MRAGQRGNCLILVIVIIGFFVGLSKIMPTVFSTIKEKMSSRSAETTTVDAAPESAQPVLLKRTASRRSNCVLGSFPENGAWTGGSKQKATNLISVEHRGTTDSVLVFEGSKWDAAPLTAFVRAGQTARFPIEDGDYLIRTNEGEGWCVNSLDFQLHTQSQTKGRIAIRQDTRIVYFNEDGLSPHFKVVSPDSIEMGVKLMNQGNGHAAVPPKEDKEPLAATPTQGKLRLVNGERRESAAATAESGATGCEVRIPRAKDAMFYVTGSVNNFSVSFMVDTGATKVAIDGGVAHNAGISRGVPTVFKTAAGKVKGVIAEAEVAVGPLVARNIEVGVNPAGEGVALLGQSFLSRFSVVQTAKELVIVNPACR